MKPFRVLVADDDSVTRQVIARTLRDLAGIEIVEASDGNETLAALSNAAFDLLLLDWQMPGKTGGEILTALRSARSPIPVIMITATSARDQVEEALKNRVSAYVIKPFDRDYLWQKVQEVWRRHQAQGVANEATR
jgi:two-component system, chemotaxis family, chemotaxis protein CheY